MTQFDTRPLRAWMHRRFTPRTTVLISLGWIAVFALLLTLTLTRPSFGLMCFGAFWLPGCFVAFGALYDVAKASRATAPPRTRKGTRGPSRRAKGPRPPGRR
ncbi:hypothetical protein [Actinorhabdospora filicis]|uniref:hypothetical protein n=1 Tax=Actinorhabdospora filicis TaxID=1785913 RepID=UPI00255668EC|nr:hypothetical protein [Actinorhabdospora filicis]